jgi:hypothetical protein
MGRMDDSHHAFHRGTAPIFALLTPEQTQKLAQLQCDPSAADRVAELAEKSNEGAASLANSTLLRPSQYFRYVTQPTVSVSISFTASL